MLFSLNVVLFLNTRELVASAMCSDQLHFVHLISIIKADVKCIIGKEITPQVVEFLAACSSICTAPGALTCVTC